MTIITGRFSRRSLLLGAAAGSVPAIAGATHQIGPANFPTLPAAPADPLAEAIADYYAGTARFHAIPSDSITMENEEGFVQATYGPAFDRLCEDCPPATSVRGVAAAIRYTLKEDLLCSCSAEGVLKAAALAFLEREDMS
ncbi:hypothetical protein RFN28_18555 [Mesorhizobium sp. VK24D]|uniref:Uncharacterized protein n=1 Tax=Mesorhizobium album TaxID=3072314 RepID=A0ABU4Y0H7_9HYPH|nr:hypothetical protein [Mesorhizobium sp. VK24D]MDX8480449.1 hypothetical protein [Mesorhizobium sp. VK24D]